MQVAGGGSALSIRAMTSLEKRSCPELQHENKAPTKQRKGQSGRVSWLRHPTHLDGPLRTIRSKLRTFE
jgi:hypothetical protein